jgi:hypothetical protein
MARRVINISTELVNPETLASYIALTFDKWNKARSKKMKDWAEVRSYVFATDTSTTPNAALPWKNKTTRPKLCQIRDNLHANYMAALFPTEDWFQWEAQDEDSATKAKADIITLYMRNKLKQSNFEQMVSSFVLDYIDVGNVFGDVEYTNEETVLADGTVLPGYKGPKAVRISPFDIVFDPTASSFADAPKITRSLLSIGDIEKLRKTNPAWQLADQAKLDMIKRNRVQLAGVSEGHVRKSEGLIADGFGSITQYYSSGMVEVLEFEGDIFLESTGELLENHIVTIVDRAYVIRKERLQTWTGTSTKQHCGWRLRPDNLWAMGPLDNLVGMQYRVDHLENIKADVFDLIAYPITKVKGYVEDFKYAPLARIYMDTDADVEFLRPDTTALNADMQIHELEDQMEEMAGAPKQAMGIRTPGEKTKFEVQTLENSAGRTFQNKISYFEKQFIEPLLNMMLEVARRSMDSIEAVKVTDPELGVQSFLNITKADLEAKGRLVPIGARHFAAQAQLIQNLASLSATNIYQDPAVQVHFSGIKLAKLIEENLGLASKHIVEPNIRIMEQADTQKLLQTAQDQTHAESMTPPITPEDMPRDPNVQTG